MNSPYNLFSFMAQENRYEVMHIRPPICTPCIFMDEAVFRSAAYLFIREMR